MSASGNAIACVPDLVSAPSAYADQMPKQREFAELASADPRRGVLRDELILAFLPVAGEPVTLQADSGPTTCAAAS
jgi:hypothetical protein